MNWDSSKHYFHPADVSKGVGKCIPSTISVADSYNYNQRTRGVASVRSAMIGASTYKGYLKSLAMQR
jgi:hypothetical protein